MVRLAALVLGIAGFGLPVAEHALRPAPRTVEQQLLRQVNSSPAGRMTRRVSCRSAVDGRFSCTLHGLSLTSPARLHVDVVAHGGSLRPVFGAVEG